MSNELKVILNVTDENDNIISSLDLNVVRYSLRTVDVSVNNMIICEISFYHLIHGEETISKIMIDLTECGNTNDVKSFIYSYITAVHNNRILRLYGIMVNYLGDSMCEMFKLNSIE